MTPKSETELGVTTKTQDILYKKRGGKKIEMNSPLTADRMAKHSFTATKTDTAFSGFR